MSYIRSGSNPEGLYAWCDCEGVINISEGSKPLHSLPLEDFHGVLTAWWQDRVGEEIADDNEHFVSGSIRLDYFLEKGEHFGKWRMTHGDWTLFLWTVTLFSLAFQVARRAAIQDP
jgi:hypothetical protein